MEDLFVWYIQHTYFWAAWGGANIDMSELLEEMRFVLIVSAVIFYIWHLVMPYGPVQKIINPSLKDDPPPKILLTFSAGQFVSYLMSTFGLPFIVFVQFPYPQSWPTSEAILTVLVCLGILIFVVGAGVAESRIDMKRRHK